MDDKRKKEVLKIIEHFQGTVVTNEVIKEFCKVQNIEPITKGDLSDYMYQIKSDELVKKILPLILGKLSGLQVRGLFYSEAKNKEIDDANEAIQEEIVIVMEENALPYKLVDLISQEVANFAGGTIGKAGIIAKNKADEVLTHIAEVKFGEKLNMKQVADYAEGVILNHFEGKK